MSRRNGADPVLRPLRFRFARRPGTRGAKVHLRYYSAAGLAACGRELYLTSDSGITIHGEDTEGPVSCGDCLVILHRLSGCIVKILLDAKKGTAA